MTKTLEERFREKFTQEDADKCWIWLGAMLPNGYGSFSRGAGTNQTGAHRVAYEFFVGPIPPGLTIDHTCHNSDPNCVDGNSCRHRRCVNPKHLEAVTLKINLHRGRTPCGINAKKTHCDHGHELTESNVRITRVGSRSCRECAKRISARSNAAIRAKGTIKRDEHGLRLFCRRGHPFTFENIYVHKGGRQCKTCNWLRNHKLL